MQIALLAYMQALYNPCNILAFAELGARYELSAQSGSAFVLPDEEISYWQLLVSHSSWHLIATIAQMASNACAHVLPCASGHNSRS